MVFTGGMFINSLEGCIWLIKVFFWLLLIYNELFKLLLLTDEIEVEEGVVFKYSLGSTGMNFWGLYVNLSVNKGSEGDDSAIPPSGILFNLLILLILLSR